MGIDILKSKTWVQNNMFKAIFAGSPIDGLEHCIKSVAMPDFTRSAIEEFNNGIWYYTHGRQEMYILSITFVDNEQDKVYDKALEFWESQHIKYPIDKWFSIYILRASRSNRESLLGGVFFEECLLDSISGLQYDNSSQSTLLEFTITFKTSKAKKV